MHRLLVFVTLTLAFSVSVAQYNRNTVWKESRIRPSP